jgi:hypothetical protein
MLLLTIKVVTARRFTIMQGRRLNGGIVAVVAVFSLCGHSASHAQTRGQGDAAAVGEPVEAEIRAQGIAAPALRTRNGSVALKVTDYNGACRRIIEIVAAQGGELIDTHTEVTDSGRRHGWLHLRVPAARLTTVLPRVREAGTLYGERVTSTDGASEYANLGHRVERLRQHEGRLAGVLETRQRGLRGSDVLYLQERLFRASVDESLLAQQRADLLRRGEVSLVTVRLFEPLPLRARDRATESLAAHFSHARERASDMLSAQARRAATASAYLLVFAPLWLPALIATLFAARWVVRRLAVLLGRGDIVLPYLRGVATWIGSTLRRGAVPPT